MAGSETEITITVRDMFGNPVSGAGDELSASVSDGPNEGAPFTEVTEQGNGEYLTSYTPTSIGDDQISIEVNNQEIPDSPFTSTVSTT